MQCIMVFTFTLTFLLNRTTDEALIAETLQRVLFNKLKGIENENHTIKHYWDARCFERQS